jgi:hypothetical protein|tara:strand:+ start:261 stop:596 length:336 start_codon:yes stop_codon:yes gene_type:complete
MSKFASGRFAKRISDRSGMAFPYNEMVEEWTGARVHYTEFEAKHPQLEPRPIVQDPQSLQFARAQIANSTCFVGIIGVNTNRFSSVGMQPKTEAKETRLQSFSGNVTVSTS